MVTIRALRPCARRNTDLRAARFPPGVFFSTLTSPKHVERKGTMTSTRPADYARLMEAAKRHAEQLRREAIADFWSEATATALRSLRSARRLASRLERRAQLRGRREASVCPRSI
jgi:hypothetical protein